MVQSTARRKKQCGVEELLETTRHLLKEADAEFPQYAARIAETLTTQHIVNTCCTRRNKKKTTASNSRKPAQKAE
jgi:hypothetical protein